MRLSRQADCTSGVAKNHTAVYSVAEGDAQQINVQIYPSKDDRQVESVDLNRVMQAIDQYIDKIIELITLNRCRTKLARFFLAQPLDCAYRTFNWERLAQANCTPSRFRLGE